MPSPFIRAPSLRVSADALRDTMRAVPEETPVALVYDGATHAVMMATPADLEDFAVGFSLTEGMIASPDEIEALGTVEHENGLEVRMWLAQGAGRTAAERRRRIVGPTGCGLCGVDSLAAAVPPARPVGEGGSFTRDDVTAALEALAPAQALSRETRAVHAAGFWSRERGLLAVREDVGRHNALDKLAGALARYSPPPCGEGLGVGVIPTSDVRDSPPLSLPHKGGGTALSKRHGTTLGFEGYAQPQRSLPLVGRREGQATFERVGGIPASDSGETTANIPHRDERPSWIDPASGLVLLTSRVSVEMVQKTAAVGAPILVAISAPTALALRVAEAAGITLVAVARPDAFEVFTHPHRLVATASEFARGSDVDAA